MKKLIGITALFLSSVIYAQTPQSGVGAVAIPLSETPSRTNVKIVIKTESLEMNTIKVEINGREIAAMEGDQTYTGVFSPGEMQIIVPGGKPEGSIKFIAEPNKEYLFNVAVLSSPPAGAIMLFGFLGALATGGYSFAITLKDTRDILAGLPPSVVAEKVAPKMQPQARQSTQVPSAQSAPSRSDERPQEIAKTNQTSPSSIKDIQAAQQLVVEQPSNVGAWRELAKQYQATGESDKAIRAYQEAVRLEPNDVSTLEELGSLYAQAGLKEKVRATWESLTKIDRLRAEKFFATYVLP